jgi:Double zinc ribbon
MGLIQFVQNYEDLSTDKGFQFKFYCDKCHNGFMTHFQASALGVAESALQVASNLFGGFFSTASNSAYEVQRAIGGKAHDGALEEAVREGKEHFHQCTRCGKWVCPETCWNAQAGLCEGCAPNFQEEMAAQQAQAKVEAAREQPLEKARHTDYVSDVDMGAKAVLAVPGPTTTATDHCTGCGVQLGHGARFCPSCGSPRRAPGCPGCGAAVQPSTKFCDQCGTKVV